MSTQFTKYINKYVSQVRAYVEMHVAATVVVCVAFVVVIGTFFAMRGGHLPFLSPSRVVTQADEKLVIPDAHTVVKNEARTVQQGEYHAPIDPARGEIVSARAVHTIKSAYTLASSAASAWDAKSMLVYAKSLGAITKDGKSGEWLIVFGSSSKKKGYEIIVYGDSIASKREIATKDFGHALPKDWYDSGDAIASISTQPQFAEATMSSIHFFYNEDGKRWGYALATSKGTISMPVK